MLFQELTLLCCVVGVIMNLISMQTRPLQLLHIKSLPPSKQEAGRLLLGGSLRKVPIAVAETLSPFQDGICKYAGFLHLLK